MAIPGMTFAWNGAVIRIMESLLALQRIKLQNRRLLPEQESECERLRANVPAAVLEKFDRLVSRGRKAVAIVRNGVCSECHLLLPLGSRAGLACMNEIHVCDNCGRYLSLPEERPSGLSDRSPITPELAKTPVKRTPSKAIAHLV
jgi:hypothetical protein